MKREDFIRLIHEGRDARNIFWEQEYPLKSKSEKVNYWLSSIHQGMRSQGEATGDEYGHFSLQWYEKAKFVEENFDEIMMVLVPRLGFPFDWKEYHKRILK